MSPRMEILLAQLMLVQAQLESASKTLAVATKQAESSSKYWVRNRVAELERQTTAIAIDLGSIAQYIKDELS